MRAGGLVKTYEEQDKSQRGGDEIQNPVCVPLQVERQGQRIQDDIYNGQCKQAEKFPGWDWICELVEQ